MRIFPCPDAEMYLNIVQLLKSMNNMVYVDRHRSEMFIFKEESSLCLKKVPVIAACLIMAWRSRAWGAEAPSARTSRSAVMQSPARDGAYVLELPGLVNSEKHTTISGMKKTIDDGIVIRKSRIKSDGTIVIPRRIYTTVRCGNWKPFDNEKIYVGPTPFYYINQRSARTVLQNQVFQLGEVKPMNPNRTRGWELSGISTNTYMMPGAFGATFKLVKTTGNYYGSTFEVETGPAVTNDAPTARLWLPRATRSPVYP